MSMKDYKEAPPINLSDGIRAGIGDTSSSHTMTTPDTRCTNPKCTNKRCVGCIAFAPKNTPDTNPLDVLTNPDREAEKRELYERALEKTQAEQESKTTPDAEWEKESIYKILKKMYEDKHYIDCAYEDIKSLLTSRDTYWKERVRSKREALAELEHDQWIAWSKNIAETEQITPARLERWKSLWRPYAELTEAEKDQDREWADQALDTLLDNLK